ncbi:MAG: cytochrome b/b6 domain-containing protein, partial [Bdellovibrionales bacterium]|nr:cytochrome b/b6 domain-containing protein [Bdellovibrionales bacterium]
HNPASSWAALLMLTLALGLGLTGYLMASGYKETFEDIHEIFANGLLVVALLHIAGVLLHSLRHRDGIIMTMYHGAKSDISTAESISKTRPAVALLFIVLVAAFATQLARNFDTQKQTLSFFGDSLHLGENERDNNSHHDDD